MKAFKDLRVWTNVFELHPCTCKAAMTVSQQHPGENSPRIRLHVIVMDNLESTLLY